MGEEVEEVERQPRGGEGKNCLGKRRETLRGAIVEARELWPKGSTVFSEHVQMPECCVRGKRGGLANKGGGELGNPVVESTGEKGTGEGGDRRRAKGTMKVRDKAGKG